MKDDKPVPPHLYDREYFLTSCGGYEDYLDSRGEIIGHRLQKVLDLAKVERGMKVLDVGCGRGEIIKQCILRGSYPIGIDFSVDALKLVVETLEDERGPYFLCRSDAKALPFTEESYDRVILADIVEHLYPNDVEMLMKEVYRVLSPKGTVIIHTTPNVWSFKYGYPIRRLYLKLVNNFDLPKSPRDDHYDPIMHVNEQSIFSLRTSLKKAGFKFKIWLVPANLYQGDNKFKNFLNKIIEKSPLNLLFSNNIFALAWRE